MGAKRVATGVIAALVLTVAGCASVDPGTPSPSTSAPPSSTSSPSPSRAEASPSPSGSAATSAQSSAPVQVDGWTYSMVRDLCVTWINTKPLDDPPIRYDFDTQLPAERYADAWNLAFPAVYTDPVNGAESQAIATCAVTGTPDDYAVGEPTFVGDERAVEAELLP